ncbi:MAG: hypothetical protein GTN69_08480 [Armatimonadetes bacterium]|nr:hypothetical protein [Gemmatimonadales bacterium]NIO75899.1 hypothetical protein [Armatimonadota bacterium]
MEESILASKLRAIGRVSRFRYQSVLVVVHHAVITYATVVIKILPQQLPAKSLGESVYAFARCVAISLPESGSAEGGKPDG